MCLYRIVMIVIVSVLALEAWAQQGLEPVLPEEPDYSKYASKMTGFAGVNRQQVSYWELKPAPRTRWPGYKGALVRMPNGDLIATPMNPEAGPEGQLRAIVQRSQDGGLTWEEVAAPPDLPGKEHGLAVLADGTLLHIDYGGRISRSEDGGKTWEIGSAQLPFSAFSRNIEEREDGTLVLVGVRGGPRTAEQLILCTSKDGGRTWEGKEVPVEAGYPVFMDYSNARVMAEEPSWLSLPDGRLLLAFRAEQSRIIGDEVPPFARDYYGETGDHMVLTESTDGGEHWSMPKNFTNYGEPHGFLTLLQDGRLLCTYANYHLPFGAAAILSEDRGKTWDTDHPILLGVAPTAYAGYPTSVQLPDGTMVTTWAGNGAHIVRWSLPKASDG